MGEPVVMIGMGAAKAGTSWLHRYLSDHPECHFRAIKELHYFGVADLAAWDRNVMRVRAIRDRIAGEVADDLKPRQLANKVRNLAHVEHYLEVLGLGTQDREAYLGYLTEGCGDARVVGELTPAYSLMSLDEIRAVATLSPQVRIVYLLRDPIERLWSHVRMIAAQRCRQPGEFSDRAANILSRVFRGREEQIARRSDYAGPLARLTRAVEPEKLFIGLFEDIFQGNLVERLCAFLGIRLVRPNVATAVNQGRPLVMRPDQMAAALEWLTPQYHAVQSHFGALPAAWTQNLARVS